MWTNQNLENLDIDSWRNGLVSVIWYGRGMGICLDRNSRYWSTPGGSPHRRPSSDRHDTLPLLLPKIFHQKISQNLANFHFALQPSNFPTLLVHTTFTLGLQFTLKLRPTNSHPFQLTLKLVPLTGKCMGGGGFLLYKIWWAHFGLNSGANVLSVRCWLSPFLSLYWQPRL